MEKIISSISMILMLINSLIKFLWMQKAQQSQNPYSEI